MWFGSLKVSSNVTVWHTTENSSIFCLIWMCWLPSARACSSKTLLQQHPPNLNLECWLTLVDLHIGHKMVVYVCFYHVSLPRCHRLLAKNNKFFLHTYICTLVGVTPLKFHSDVWHQKISIPTLPCGINCMMIYSDISKHYQLETDIQMDTRL